MQTHHKKTKKTLVKVLLTAIILSQVISGGLALASIFSSKDTSKTTFTDFKGGLQAPSTTGYAPGLVQATDARQYILNVTNFFLGFLGLIAVAVIIYGGFMYVTDMGKGESQGKGKKAITYAITGLLIVLGSYAIVNTVLQATSPEGPGTGVGTGGVVATSSFNRLAAQVQLMAKDIESAYTWQYAAAGDLFNAKMAMVEAFKAGNKYNGEDNPQPMLAEFQTNIESTLRLMNQINITFPQIQSEIELGDTSMGAKIAAFSTSLKNYADGAISRARNEIARANASPSKKGTKYIACEATKDIASGGVAIVTDAIGVTDNPCDAYKDPDYSNVRAIMMGDYTGSILDSGPLNASDAQEGGKPLINFFVSAQKSILEQFQNVVIGTQRKLREYYLIVTPITTIADGEFMKLVPISMIKTTAAVAGNDNVAWLDNENGSNPTFTMLAQLRFWVTKDIKDSTGGAPIMPADSDISNFGPAMSALSALYEKLKDLKFVDARLTASATEGNAPFVVNFSSIGSTNPNGKTILDGQISWDLDGNGDALSPNNWNTLPNDSTRFIQCNEAALQTTSCIYLVPGTYRVRLRIKAAIDADDKDPVTGKPYVDIIGQGTDTVTIKVNPPETKLTLKVTAGALNPQTVMSYDDKGFITENRESINVPLSAARAGVKFDATLSRTKSGAALTTEAAQGATIRWDFGDNTGAVTSGATKPTNDKDTVKDSGGKLLMASDANLTQTHSYSAEGAYTVTVEVTNKEKITDRKIFTLNVAELVPIMFTEKNTYNVKENIKFDGADSVSDTSKIVSWYWSSLPNEDGFPSSAQTKPDVDYAYKQAGIYTVTLKVEDNSKVSTIADSRTIKVTSAPPVASFSYRFVNPRKPGVIELDSNKSYDPDSVGKKYAYTWSLNGDDIVTSPSYSTDNLTLPDFLTIDRYEKTSGNLGKFEFNFKKTGTYTIGLVITDQEDISNHSKKVEKDITIASILDVDITGNPTNIVNGEVNIPIVSENAVTYRIDFGDGQKAEASWPTSPRSNTLTVKHTYTAAGTYLVTAFVFDNDNNENSVTRQVYVTSTTAPTAIISMKVNNENKYPDAVQEGGKTISTLFINRNDTISFDANESKNVDNTGRRLQYNWTLMTGATKLDQSPQKQYTRTFDEKGEYEVSLVVTNADNLSQSSAASTVKVKVEPSPVTISGLTAVPVGSDLTTPVDVKVTAIGGEKPDGQIVSYKWWYFDVLKNRPEGVQITQSPTATITVGTLGASKTESTYAFALEMTDNENNRTTVKGGCPVTDEEKKKGFICIDKLPSVTVTNGPNDLPVAKFNVDRTTINVGESVQFISSSTDPDGNIKYYTWDFEGNGFFDNNPIPADAGDAGAIQNKQFDKVAPDGISVSLKVEDNNGGIAYSTPVVIYVEGQVPPPVAAFTSAQQGTTNTVQFTDKSSTSDLVKDPIISRVWDFDTSEDTSGDGIKDNDNDVGNTTTTAPSHTYSEPGIYRARLTVTDKQGQINSVSNFVKVIAPLKPAAPQIPLDARLLTTPSANMSDGRIHLQGESANVTLDYSTSTGNIIKYVIDKNINFDTNGNGNPYDDEDKVDTKPGSWTTGFSRSFGNITIRLTVIDSNGSSKSVDKSIVFDPKPVGGANIFSAGELNLTALLVSTVGFAILASVIFKVLPKGSKED